MTRWLRGDRVSSVIVEKLFHIVKSRYLPGPAESARLTTAGMREAFLVEDLFVPGQLRLTLTDMDRLVVGAALPTTAPIALPALLNWALATSRSAAKWAS